MDRPIFADLGKHSTWLDPVGSAGALPGVAADGAMIVTRDTGDVYQYSTTLHAWHIFGGGGGGGGSIFETNACFVDPNGNDGSGARGSPILKFKTIQAALAAAHTNDAIIVSPGTYTENPVISTLVSIIGADRRSVIISGNVTWNPVGASDEIASLQRLTVTGDVGMDASGKTGGAGYFFIVDCSAATGTTVGRVGLNVDGLWLEDIDLPENDGTRWTISATNGILVADKTELGGITGHGDLFISVSRTEVLGPVHHIGQGSTAFIYCQLVGTVLLDAPFPVGPFEEARYCIFYADVSVGPGGWTWNAYQCSFLSTIGANGPGFVNHTPEGPMTGASSGTDGASGFVPQPHAGDNTKFLRGDGTWADVGAPIKANVSTFDATPVAAWTFPLQSATTYSVEATLVAVSDDQTHRASYKRHALVSRTGSAAAVLNGASQAIGTDAETDAGLDAAFDVSGNNVRLMVTGLPTPNFTWEARITVISVAGGPS